MSPVALADAGTEVPETMPLLPLFLKLAGRTVVVIGGGKMAVARVAQLAVVGAKITVVAPQIAPEIAASGARLVQRPFVAADLDGAWFVVAAATPEANREVARLAEERRLFVNAVDDPESASAYTGAVVRRGAAVIAVSTGGRAPALAGLLREALATVLPDDLCTWLHTADSLRDDWRRSRIPLAARRPLLLAALNRLYGGEGTTPPERTNADRADTDKGEA